MNRFRPLLASTIALVCLGASFAARADALATLNDAELFKNAQKDIASAKLPELEALNIALADCAAATLGQRAQHYDCERGLNAWWTRWAHGRPIDSYVAAMAGLFNGFDNMGANPTEAMSNTYRKLTVDLVALQHSLNDRFRQLDSR